jgi:hypothetical protein
MFMNSCLEMKSGLMMLKCMAKGWPYSRAHTESSRLEYHCRHHPDELHDKLTADGWA